MRSIVPSAAVLRQKYATVSALRAQGFAIASCEDGKPGAQDLFLIADGEVPPAAARTLILGEGDRTAIPFRDGNPARLSYDSEDAAIGAGFASAMARGPYEPVSRRSREPCFAGARRARRGFRHHRADQRPHRHRQGSARQGDPHGLHAPRRPVRRDQLRRAARDDARGNAVRPPQGLVHRRVVGRAGLLPRRQWRHACCSTKSPRCRLGFRPSCSVRCRSAKSFRSAAPAGEDRRSRHCLRQSRSAGRSRRRPLPRRSLLPPRGLPARHQGAHRAPGRHRRARRGDGAASRGQPLDLALGHLRRARDPH
jgi:hypothetical protein